MIAQVIFIEVVLNFTAYYPLIIPTAPNLPPTHTHTHTHTHDGCHMWPMTVGTLRVMQVSRDLTLIPCLSVGLREAY